MKCAESNGLNCNVCPLNLSCPNASARAAVDRVLDRPGEFGRVVDRLRRDPGLRVCLVEPSWDSVDAARARVREAGLDDRLAVHHASALRLARAG